MFARTGSARAVVAAFRDEKLLFPVRIGTGPRKGELAWMALTHWRVLRTLHNPRYAGAFAYGRRREAVAANGKKTFQALPRDQWTALIPGAHPGYITWEAYEANQKLLLGNAAARGTDRAAGPAREGTALLQGLAVCGRCGRRMTVRYHTRGGIEVPDYQCVREAIDNAGRRCQTIPGAPADAAASQLLLATLTPLSLEVALTVQAEIEARAADADTMRRSHVERARHRADLARRRYLAVDPGNRLVAGTLEADWNDALRALQTAQDDYDDAAAGAAALSERRPGPHPGAGRRLPRPVVRPGHPAARAQAHDPPAHRRRHHDQDRPHPPARPVPRRPDHQPDRPDPAACLASSARPLPAPSPNSTVSSTTTPTPKPPTPSTPPGTAPAKASRSPPGSCSNYAAATTCPATPTGSAPAACSPSPKSPAVSACTSPPSRPGAAPGCSPPTRPTTRTSRCSTRPRRATPGWSNARAASSPDEFTPQQHQEVQYETHVLS